MKMRSESALVLGGLQSSLDTKGKMKDRRYVLGEKIYKLGKRGAVKIRKKLPKNRFDDDGRNSS